MLNISSSQSVMLGRGRLWCWSCGATSPFLFWDLCLGCITEPVSNSCWNLLELEIWSSHPEPTAHKQRMLLGHQSATATWCTVSAAQTSPPSLASILPPACLVSLCFFSLIMFLGTHCPSPELNPLAGSLWCGQWFGKLLLNSGTKRNRQQKHKDHHVGSRTFIFCGFFSNSPALSVQMQTKPQLQKILCLINLFLFFYFIIGLHFYGCCFALLLSSHCFFPYS